MSQMVNEKPKSLKKNYLYNLFYQLFLLIVPLVTAPYLSRILQNDGVGKNSFVLSINSYFTLFAALGFGYYAQREIAKCLGDKEKQSRIFWEICFIKFLSTFLCILIYLLIAFLLPSIQSYRDLFLIYTANILAVAFDVTFIFQGNEDFKQISLRNFVVKALTVACIFIFVKTRSDVWVYATIHATGTLISSLVMLPFLNKYLVKVHGFHPFRHLLPAVRLFVPTIAVSLYTMLDKTMIGFMVPGEVTIIENGVEVVKKTSDIESGYYSQSENLIKMVLVVITSLGAVMIPRNTSDFKSGKIDEAKENIYKAIRFTFFLGIPMAFGLVATARNFCPWFFGDGYEKVPYLIMIFSPLVLFIGLSNVFGLQWLIPKEKDGLFTISIVCGALVNVTLNSFLIPLYYSYGAAIASIVAEFVVTFVQIMLVRKDFVWKQVFGSSWRYFVSGIFMFAIVFTLSYFLPAKYWATLILVIIGIIVYLLFLMVLKDDFFISYFQRIFHRIFKKHDSTTRK